MTKPSSTRFGNFLVKFYTCCMFAFCKNNLQQKRRDKSQCENGFWVNSAEIFPLTSQMLEFGPKGPLALTPSDQANWDWVHFSKDNQSQTTGKLSAMSLAKKRGGGVVASKGFMTDMVAKPESELRTLSSQQGLISATSIHKKLSHLCQPFRKRSWEVIMKVS